MNNMTTSNFTTSATIRHGTLQQIPQSVDSKSHSATRKIVDNCCRDGSRSPKMLTDFSIDTLIGFEQTDNRQWPESNRLDKQTGRLEPSALESLSMSMQQRLTNSEGRQTSSNVRKYRPKNFRCPCCKMAFSNNGQLKNHVRIHTGERPFKCNFETCNKTFTRNEELTRHKLIHSGVRPHSCSSCGKRFGRKDHLKKHFRTHERKRMRKKAAALIARTTISPKMITPTREVIVDVDDSNVVDEHIFIKGKHNTIQTVQPLTESSVVAKDTIVTNVSPIKAKRRRPICDVESIPQKAVIDIQMQQSDLVSRARPPNPMGPGNFPTASQEFIGQSPSLIATTCNPLTTLHATIPSQHRQTPMTTVMSSPGSLTIPLSTSFNSMITGPPVFPARFPLQYSFDQKMATNAVAAASATTATIQQLASDYWTHWYHFLAHSRDRCQEKHGQITNSFTPNYNFKSKK